MNRQFASMLEAQELLEWQERALEYAAREDLYSRTEQVVEEIETLAAKLQKNA
jgi:hypothetical protein